MNIKTKKEFNNYKKIKVKKGIKEIIWDKSSHNSHHFIKSHYIQGSFEII